MQALQSYYLEYTPLVVDVVRILRQIEVAEMTDEGRETVDNMMTFLQPQQEEYVRPTLLQTLDMKLVRRPVYNCAMYCNGSTSDTNA